MFSRILQVSSYFCCVGFRVVHPMLSCYFCYGLRDSTRLEFPWLQSAKSLLYDKLLPVLIIHFHEVIHPVVISHPHFSTSTNANVHVVAFYFGQ